MFQKFERHADRREVRSVGMTRGGGRGRVFDQGDREREIDAVVAALDHAAVTVEKA
jgi:hypothetical protein